MSSTGRARRQRRHQPRHQREDVGAAAEGDADAPRAGRPPDPPPAPRRRVEHRKGGTEEQPGVIGGRGHAGAAVDHQVGGHAAAAGVVNGADRDALRARPPHPGGSDGRRRIVDDQHVRGGLGQ